MTTTATNASHTLVDTPSLSPPTARTTSRVASIGTIEANSRNAFS